MRNRFTILLFVLLQVVLTTDTLHAQDAFLQELEEIAIVDQRVVMTMRDGIRLPTDIYRPKTDEKVTLH